MPQTYKLQKNTNKFIIPNVQQGGPKNLYIFQHTISLETFKMKWNGFRQNVPRVAENKDYVAIFV